MAWTYTQPSHNSGWSDKNTRIVWENRWSVSEQTPDAAHPGKIRLRVAVVTESYHVSPTGYVSPVRDTLSCGGETVAVHSGSLTPASHDYTYTEDVYVPLSWSGKTVELYICWTRVSVVCGAVGDFASTIGAADGTFGAAIPITLARKVAGTTHTVTVACGGRTETLLTDSAASSVSWTPPLAVYGPLFPSAMSGTATISCTTHFGGESRSTSKSITVRFKAADVKPALSAGWAAAAWDNSGTAAAGIAAWVQGYSRAQISFTPSKISCRYGASIAGCAIACGGVTVTGAPYRTGTLSGTAASILCTVTDSRGQSASETLSVALLPYAKPALTGVGVFRSDASGAADEEGSCIAVTAAAELSSLGGLNSGTLKVWTAAGAGAYTDRGTLTSGTRRILTGFSADTSYTVKLELTDALGNTAVVTRLVSTRAWAMKFRPDGRGVAFGKAAETDRALELPADWGIRVGTADILCRPGTHAGTLPCFGYVTNGGKRLTLYFLPSRSLIAANTVRFTEVSNAGILLPAGGYLGGGAGQDLSDCITAASPVGGALCVRLERDSGWGANQVPVTGTAFVRFTVT